jgi:hypothetical protein
MITLTVVYWKETPNRAERDVCTTMLENFRALRKFFASQSGIYSRQDASILLGMTDPSLPFSADLRKISPFGRNDKAFSWRPLRLCARYSDLVAAQ